MEAEAATAPAPTEEPAPAEEPAATEEPAAKPKRRRATPKPKTEAPKSAPKVARRRRSVKKELTEAPTKPQDLAPVLARLDAIGKIVDDVAKKAKTQRGLAAKRDKAIAALQGSIEAVAVLVEVMNRRQEAIGTALVEILNDKGWYDPELENIEDLLGG